MITSNLLKVSRAVRGDDWFVERIKIACVLQGVDYSERLAMQVASAVVDHIDVDENMTVSTHRVTDTEIEAAVISLAQASPG